MHTLEYQELVREYQRMDLLREAARQRLVTSPRSGLARALRSAERAIACQLSLPAWEAACAAQPA
jgi:hypothetical protein